MRTAIMRWVYVLALLGWACAVSLAVAVRPLAAQVDPVSANRRPGLGEGEPVPEDDYWQMLSDALSRVQQLQNEKSLGESPLVDTADQIEGVKSVRLASGQVVPVDNADLVAALRRKNPGWFDLSALKSQLSALTQAGRDWPRVSPDPSAMDELSAVLASPEFQPPTAAPPSWLQQVWERLEEWLNELFSRIGLGDVHLPGLNWVITAVGVLVLAAVTFFFVRSLRANLVAEADLEEAIDGGKLSSSAALKQAQQLAAGADYRSAVRFLYLATVLALDERGLLRFDKALTNREVLRQSSTSERLKGELSPVVETFDKVWYGLMPMSDEQYREYESQVARAREVKPE